MPKTPDEEFESMIEFARKLIAHPDVTHGQMLESTKLVMLTSIARSLGRIADSLSLGDQRRMGRFGPG